MNRESTLEIRKIIYWKGIREHTEKKYNERNKENTCKEKKRIRAKKKIHKNKYNGKLERNW